MDERMGSALLYIELRLEEIREMMTLEFRRRRLDQLRAVRDELLRVSELLTGACRIDSNGQCICKQENGVAMGVALT